MCINHEINKIFSLLFLKITHKVLIAKPSLDKTICAVFCTTSILDKTQYYSFSLFFSCFINFHPWSHINQFILALEIIEYTITHPLNIARLSFNLHKLHFVTFSPMYVTTSNLSIWPVLHQKNPYFICRLRMNLQKDKGEVEGMVFQCPDWVCRKKLSIRNGTFFSKSNLPIKAIMLVIFCWAKNVPETFLLFWYYLLQLKNTPASWQENVVAKDVTISTEPRFPPSNNIAGWFCSFHSNLSFN